MPRVPASHTAFSWLRRSLLAARGSGDGAVDSGCRQPRSHTPFSWRRRDAASAASVGAQTGDGTRPAADYLIDVDANLLSADLVSDGDATFHISAAAGVGVRRFVLPAACVRDIPRALALAAGHGPGVVFPCAGVHPYWAAAAGEAQSDTCEPFTPAGVAAVAAAARRPEVAAVGECGLDYSPHFPPREVQAPWFEAQVAIAAEVGKPLFLHERLAFDDVMKVLSKHGFVRDGDGDGDARAGRGAPPAVLVHCFTGTREEMLRYVEAGFFIGVSGHFLTSRGAGQRAWLREIPLSRLMLETDAPYMGFKGCRKHPDKLYRKPSRTAPNVPSALAAVAAAVAELYGISALQLARATTHNAERFFSMQPLAD